MEEAYYVYIIRYSLNVYVRWVFSSPYRIFNRNFTVRSEIFAVVNIYIVFCLDDAVCSCRYSGNFKSSPLAYNLKTEARGFTTHKNRRYPNADLNEHHHQPYYCSVDHNIFVAVLSEL